MKASLAIFILTVLLPMGTSLECEVCHGTGNSCTGPLETCIDGQDFCSISISEATMEKSQTQSIVKACATSKQCNASFISMNFGKGLKIRTGITCCLGDTCKTAKATVPQASTKRNGHRCHACSTMFGGQCWKETIDCTGAEIQCADIAWNITADPPVNTVILKGCATTSFCNQIEPRLASIMRIQAELINANCRAVSIPVSTAAGPTGLFLPTLAGLLLLQLFF